MENLQPLQNQEEIDRLRVQNAELKRNLEREQKLHTMLYNEWKELDEQKSNEDHELHHPKPVRSFYKYAFFGLLILAVPAYFFLNQQKGPIEKVSTHATNLPSSIADSGDLKNVPLKESVAPVVSKPVVVKEPTAQQKIDPPPQPVIKKEVLPVAQKDTVKSKKAVVLKPEAQLPLTEAEKDSIYWQGWNAYYNNQTNPFKKSTEKYKVWQEGWNDGKNDAKKLAKDSKK